MQEDVVCVRVLHQVVRGNNVMRDSRIVRMGVQGCTNTETLTTLLEESRMVAYGIAIVERICENVNLHTEETPVTS
jgi:hypothetical protein